MDELNPQMDWRQWLEAHAPRFLLYARQQSRCEADAQDLVQEALAEVCRRLGAQTPPGPALVYATIRRRAIDLARGEARRARRETASCPAPEPWFDAAVEEREHAALIQQALRKLPEIYCEVITLKIWGGLTFAEIAKATGVPANTAASRYRYGLEALREMSKGVLI